MLDISFAGAALAGLLSFFTPCILPMVPFYLCYMAGISMTELRDHAGLAPGAQRRLLLSSGMRCCRAKALGTYPLNFP